MLSRFKLADAAFHMMRLPIGELEATKHFDARPIAPLAILAWAGLSLFFFMKLGPKAELVLF